MTTTDRPDDRPDGGSRPDPLSFEVGCSAPRAFALWTERTTSWHLRVEVATAAG